MFSKVSDMLSSEFCLKSPSFLPIIAIFARKTLSEELVWWCAEIVCSSHRTEQNCKTKLTISLNLRFDLNIMQHVQEGSENALAPPPPPPPCWDFMLRTPQFKKQHKSFSTQALLGRSQRWKSSIQWHLSIAGDERVAVSGTSALLGPVQGARKQRERAIQAPENPTLASSLSNSKVLKGAEGRTGPNSSLLSCPHSPFFFSPLPQL